MRLEEIEIAHVHVLVKIIAERERHRNLRIGFLEPADSPFHPIHNKRIFESRSASAEERGPEIQRKFIAEIYIQNIVKFAPFADIIHGPDPDAGMILRCPDIHLAVIRILAEPA